MGSYAWLLGQDADFSIGGAGRRFNSELALRHARHENAACGASSSLEGLNSCTARQASRLPEGLMHAEALISPDHVGILSGPLDYAGC